MKESSSTAYATRVFLPSECRSLVPPGAHSVEIYDSAMGDTPQSAKLDRVEVASRRLKGGLMVTTSCFYSVTEPTLSSA